MAYVEGEHRLINLPSIITTVKPTAISEALRIQWYYRRPYHERSIRPMDYTSNKKRMTAL